MINTSSKTLEAQEKTQDIKQSPSMKIGTKPHARSQRNELTKVTGHWRKATGCSDQEARQQQQRPDARPDADGKLTGRRTAASDRVQRGSRVANLRPDASGGKRPDAGSVRSVVRGCNGRDDRTHPVRTISASGQ